MSEFDGKVVLVTGAGRGLGRAIAQAFAAQSAVVAADDLTPVNLDQTVAQIQAAGGSAKSYHFDVAKRLPAQALVGQVVEDWGRLDILVNNAGVEPHAPLLELDEWDWQRTLDVNLSGPFFLIQAAGKVMRDHGGGVVVNISSIAGRLIGLTRAAAQELAPHHVRVNAICPGVIETEMTANLRQDPAMMQKWLEDIPQGRLGLPADVVGLVLFLCSPAAAYLTGQAINVDGGKVMC
jgi:NAD(P)-dependent dehydrogenase (short-subunit alcohol dehydrogenase family)